METDNPVARAAADALVAVSEIEQLKLMREQKKAADALSSQLEKKISALNAKLATQIGQNKLIVGRFKVSVITKMGQCRPKWEEAFRLLCIKAKLVPEVEQERVRSETAIPATPFVEIVEL